MALTLSNVGAPSRLRALLDHFAVIDDPRQSHRVTYPPGGTAASGRVWDDRGL